jgi:23S rRNA pseudouridine1911/1915/1917 synthase
MQFQRRLLVSSEHSGCRLDTFLAQECKNLSRSYLQKLIKEGFATVNDAPAMASLKLKDGDSVFLIVPSSSPTTPIPEDIPVGVVYEDDDLVVVDKPPGLTVHPAPGHPSHTLVNALLARCPRLAPSGDPARPGIVHRLDKDTSGLMMVAKHLSSYTNLAGQIKSRSVVKRYLVLVQGHLSPRKGLIEAPIGRSKRNRKRMTVTTDGREACTQYRVVRYLEGYTLAEATLETGRTHQIRVHLSSIGHPVVGDATYGARSPFLKRQFLHSHCLGFKLPSTGEYVEFHSDLPPDLHHALEQVEKDASE